MHLTFEGRQDANKSGSRDGPEARGEKTDGLSAPPPGWSTPPVFLGVFVALVRRRKTGGDEAAVSSSGRQCFHRPRIGRAGLTAGGPAARGDVQHTMSLVGVVWCHSAPRSVVVASDAAAAAASELQSCASDDAVYSTTPRRVANTTRNAATN